MAPEPTPGDMLRARPHPSHFRLLILASRVPRLLAGSTESISLNVSHTRTNSQGNPPGNSREFEGNPTSRNNSRYRQVTRQSENHPRGSVPRSVGVPRKGAARCCVSSVLVEKPAGSTLMHEDWLTATVKRDQYEGRPIGRAGGARMAARESFKGDPGFDF